MPRISIATARRLPLMAGAIVILLAAMWGGLLRMGWAWPAVSTAVIAYHGPLMVGGFFGTLLSLERAVALRRLWPYGAPLTAALGGIAILFGLPLPLAESLLLAGSLLLFIVFIVIVRKQTTIFSSVMGIGAAAWLVGNLIWIARDSIPPAVPWWIAFLVLTIVGERLELSRFLHAARGRTPTFVGVVSIYLAGLIVGLWLPGLGWTIAGLGMLAMAAWLLIYDLARRTIHQRGLTRFVAVCLFTGYFFLALGGGLAIYYTAIHPAFADMGANWLKLGLITGLGYDAVLHSVLLGFVFAMIFGHAPIIFPAVLSLRIEFQKRFYLHWAILELSVLLRVGADLAGSWTIRQWAGIFNVIAILLFLFNTVRAMRGREPEPSTRPGSESPPPLIKLGSPRPREPGNFATL